VIKLVLVIRRRAELSPEEFHRYWLDEHGPLARRLLEPLGARRYVQTHTLDTDLNGALAASRGTAEAFDGVAEIWWDSLDGLLAVTSSEDGQRANQTLADDEARVHRLRALVALPDRGAHDHRFVKLRGWDSNPQPLD
jgi:uncharacterized protein (TIGR02118 family)